MQLSSYNLASCRNVKTRVNVSAEREDTNNCFFFPPSGYVSCGKLMNWQNFVSSAFLNSINFGTLKKLDLGICKTEDEIFESGDLNGVLPPCKGSWHVLYLWHHLSTSNNSGESEDSLSNMGMERVFKTKGKLPSRTWDAIEELWINLQVAA